jgi:post-segregation antitoxin (ccd killing protein)
MNGTYITDTGLNVSREVYHAILAAKMRHDIGRWAAGRYAVKHTTARLYRLACQLTSTKGI